MRMRSVLGVLVLFLSGTALAQNGPEMALYRSTKMKLEVGYPRAWQLRAEEPEEILVSPGLAEWGNSAHPPSPHPWFVVFRFEDTNCRINDSEKPIYTHERGAWSAVVCREGVEVFLGYWDKAPNKESTKALFERMLLDVRKIP